ncbi:unnamed protein product [Eruca vesicaria subsp. sativa]|uniref:WD repeat-containing protein 11 n=1 Tax=Eruca vesicaria subsp. sativa TaxID=29727 RepID=A0ABC8LT68_ERUVS|nr:unnamed protein product [Eruca vesicaria subsp. sativa]
MCSSSDSIILPGPPSRSNLSAADLNPSGLLAFASGPGVSLVDSQSLQLISTVSLPSPLTSVNPTVTSLRWAPIPLRRDPFSSDLLIAVGDQLGRIALVDFRVPSVRLWLEQNCDNARGKIIGYCGVQDLCWVLALPGSYIVAAISGSSLLTLYTDSGHVFWKYDASPEFISCIRCDPFDSRHFCVLGLKGFLLSIKLVGITENDVASKEFHIQMDSTDLQKLEREVVVNSSQSSSAVFPFCSAKFSFSPHWKHIIFVTFPRELVVFDLQYDATLYVVALPREYAKFVDVLPDPSQEFLYCLHFDGRLSIWRRQEGKQVHLLCGIEELMPAICNLAPLPSLLSLLISQLDSTLQNIRKIHSDPVLDASKVDDSFYFGDDAFLWFKTHFISISDDGKIWSWILSVKKDKDSNRHSNDDKRLKSSTETSFEVYGEIRNITISLVGQLQLLSATVTILAVPTPSMTATLARGGNSPAVVVPLVALGTEAGTIDVVDVSANAVAASFSAHTCRIRGLKWLGNSRLVSFSCSRVSTRTGGYINRLAVTCLRSGVSKGFRVLQKPERGPIRALKVSSSGRYLLILFRGDPVEVWAMAKSPLMIRSLTLPITVLEWTLPAIPNSSKKCLSKKPSISSNQDTNATSIVTGTPKPTDFKVGTTDGHPQDDTSESFAFALANGALGVFEVYGRRIRDFRPKWPEASFNTFDGFITAIAYRVPHVVTGDKLGNIRRWDVTSGNSSSFNTCKEGIKTIKFSPIYPDSISRGRIIVLFFDNTFSFYDFDSPDILAISVMRPQIPGTLILELDWLALRTSRFDSLVLCVVGTDGSFRLVEVLVNEKLTTQISYAKPPREKYRPVPLCTPMLLPVSHALALRMILQLGVNPSWFNTSSQCVGKRSNSVPERTSSPKDLRNSMIDFPPIGDPAVIEILLKVLEPYRLEGCLLDDEKVKLYSSLVNKGYAARFAFTSAIFGETSEAFFWLKLPCAMNYEDNRITSKVSTKHFEEATMLNKITLKGPSASGFEKFGSLSEGQLKLLAFEQKELWLCANERIPWHENLGGEEAIQNRVHELVSVGNLEGAVSLLLSTSPDSCYFYPNALRAVALSSDVSKSLVELAVKVIAANMVRPERSLSGTHLLCSVGRYQEACSQLQDAGCWIDSATLAATHLNGSDYARLLQRWAKHIMQTEHDLWRGLMLYLAIGAFKEALAAFRNAEQPETAAIFILACQETLANSWSIDDDNEDVIAVTKLYELYQEKLVHLCMDSPPFFH